ncbi:MAG: hypothetical protein GY928_02230 [Colwellia sp.]|nr:hypothetical protein [Colwellia sp.]
MILDLSNETDQQRAKSYLSRLIEKKCKIELKEIRKKRSISQNSYLHLILNAFGLNFGYSMEEVKQYFFKELVNPDIFNNGEKGELITIQDWRSTADLNTKELTTAIDRFLDYSAKNGYLLPDPKNLVFIQQLENEINSAKQYL